MMAEIIVTEENFDKEVLLSKVCKVNVDDARQLAIDYGVSSIPTVMVFQNGEIKATSVGYRPKEELEALLQ